MAQEGLEILRKSWEQGNHVIDVTSDLILVKKSQEVGGCHPPASPMPLPTDDPLGDVS